MYVGIPWIASVQNNIDLMLHRRKKMIARLATTKKEANASHSDLVHLPAYEAYGAWPYEAYGAYEPYGEYAEYGAAPINPADAAAKQKTDKINYNEMKTNTQFN